jgi:hypothetical protein
VDIQKEPSTISIKGEPVHKGLEDAGAGVHAELLVFLATLDIIVRMFHGANQVRRERVVTNLL